MLCVHLLDIIRRRGQPGEHRTRGNGGRGPSHSEPGIPGFDGQAWRCRMAGQASSQTLPIRSAIRPVVAGRWQSLPPQRELWTARPPGIPAGSRGNRGLAVRLWNELCGSGRGWAPHACYICIYKCATSGMSGRTGSIRGSTESGLKRRRWCSKMNAALSV